ncbi:hypothetical protein LCGC14_3015210 [marine sediment metagenome]|uniref:Uncharacterized protein n=1 Tax=marine sediment metagenome TaxID=412755 RepID=A0A0F8XJV0_9ZZZZ
MFKKLKKLYGKKIAKKLELAIQKVLNKEYHFLIDNKKAWKYIEEYNLHKFIGESNNDKSLRENF